MDVLSIWGEGHVARHRSLLYIRQKGKVHYIRYKSILFILILFLRVDYNDVALAELITHDDIILCLEC
jgi:hypothetical protein